MEECPSFRLEIASRTEFADIHRMSVIREKPIGFAPARFERGDPRTKRVPCDYSRNKLQDKSFPVIRDNFLPQKDIDQTNNRARE